MYSNCLDWRKNTVKLDELYETFPWEKAREGARVAYPTFFHKTDKSGSPLHIHRFGLIDLPKMLTLLTLDQEATYLWLLGEMNARERFPACTIAKRDARVAAAAADSDVDHGVLEEDVVDTVTGIMDLKGVSLWQFWKIKGILGHVLTICNVCSSKLSLAINLTSNYRTIIRRLVMPH